MLTSLFGFKLCGFGAREYKERFLDEIIAEDASRYDMELRPETERNPAQDTALFDVEQHEPVPYGPIGNGIIPFRPAIGSF